ncbi:uncharacterized protein DUF4397 [Pontibacter ummariensis]|uniref:DUF4397 domain-containing protein n=1 Tax=Pontibacter ummariensis TaxID=1610492 RepID=A0A239DMI1_9BACT|nr:DUF4397 domain-containing protein [Pontibacter ummariensis]PRY13851.1 uncharacterized protein DUF4397 [Pontibacter ummariensis]SNS33587.1 protein of unknown function [Pontibacter ummariensis]
MQNLFKKTYLSKLWSLLVVCLTAVSLSGCLDKETDLPDPTPVSYLSIYHGSPDAPALDIKLDGMTINNQPFSYTNFSGYITIKAGSHSLKFTPVNAANAYVETTMNLKENKAYSLFTVNRLQNIELLTVQDSVKTPTTGKAALRVVHLSPDAAAVDVNVAGTTSTSLATGLGFKGITPFIELAGGKPSIQIKAAGTEEVLLTVSDVQLDAGKTYTMLIRGFKTPPTGNTNTLSAQVVRNY